MISCGSIAAARLIRNRLLDVSRMDGAFRRSADWLKREGIAADS
jgi:hypothetical protein